MQSDVLELLIIYSVKSNQMINSIIFIGAISPEVVRKLNQNYATHFHKKTNAFNGLHIFATRRFILFSEAFLKSFILLGARKSAFKQKFAKDDFWMLFGSAPLNLGIIFQSI